ncbi:MAG: glycosyltransferase family 2 protein [Desulfobacteria bacterium]
MSSQSPPRVSVCIPTCNYGHFIADAIESAIGQTFGDLEVVVVDNVSTDNTSEVVARFVQADRRVRYHRNPSNLGMVGNWNRCLELAGGEFVKILCADDALEPSCLEKTVDAFEKHPGVGVVTSARSITDKNLNHLRRVSFSDSHVLRDGTVVIRECLLKGNLIGEPTAVTFRRRCAKRGFLPAYKQLTDLEMWFHLLEQGQMYAIPELLCLIRQHGGQETKANTRTLDFVDDEFRIYRDYIMKEYIRLSHVSKLKIRFTKTHNVWKMLYPQVELAQIHRKISPHMNLYLFYFLQFLYFIRCIRSAGQQRAT